MYNLLVEIFSTWIYLNKKGAKFSSMINCTIMIDCSIVLVLYLKSKKMNE